MSILKRFVTALWFAFFGFRYYTNLSKSLMGGYVKYIEFITAVYRDKKPYACDFEFRVHGDDGPEVVKIWAGIGEGAGPMKRIDELLSENKELRGLLEEINDVPRNTVQATLPKKFDPENKKHRIQVIQELSVSYDRMYRIEKALKKEVDNG